MRRQAAAASEREPVLLEVPRTHDEIEALASTLNDLLARLHGALGRERGFVAAAAHELRTPLANLKLSLELGARPGRSAAELAGTVGEAREELDRLIVLAEHLLVLAQLGDAVPLVLARPCDLGATARRALDAFAPVAAGRKVTLQLSGGDVPIVSADDAAVRRMLENVLDNAIRHAPEGSTVEVSLGIEDGREGSGTAPSWIVLEVVDEGPGFPPDFLPIALEPFSRPDHGRNRRFGGAGLGLAIVRALAEAHGGEVVVANRAGPGALVRIRLPVQVPAAGDPGPSTERTAPVANRPEHRV
jgi:two-component system, OmpR family, sensor kinase